MGTLAQTLPRSTSRLAWFWEFLRNELTPYHGRVALIVRIVTASTLVMILGMTFQFPFAAFASVFTFVISRESVKATASAVWAVIVGSALGGAYLLVSVMLIVGDAMLRFLWVGATLFMCFYVIRALNNYTASARFAYLIVIVIPVLDSFTSPSSKVTNTLWAVGALMIGSVVTLLMEAIFAAFRRADSLTDGITERLISVEELLRSYASDREPPGAAQSAIGRLAAVGTSGLRRILQRSSHRPEQKQQMGAVVALVGHLADMAANLTQFRNRITSEDREHMRRLAEDVAEIRTALARGTGVRRPAPLDVDGDVGHAPHGLPLLTEMERSASLLARVLAGEATLALVLPAPDREIATQLAPGALSDPEHFKFALRGALAAGLCYFIYNALFWPGISTSVTTCFVTALSTVGASHQKQLLRFGGVLIGGVILGFGAQIFILPNMDSIAAFTVLFVIVAAIAAWFATASARLSYLGVQIAIAFFLINLQEFKFQTSLTVVRDRVVGIVLGLLAMWLAFDWLWSTPAAVEMKKTFVSTLRLLAQLAREPVSEDRRASIERIFTLREKINAQFDKVRSLADAVIFEFGPSRQSDLAFRERIRRWQPPLRTLFLMRVASLKYRLRLPAFDLPEEIRLWHREYDNRSAEALEGLADQIEGKPSNQAVDRIAFGRLTREPMEAGMSSFVSLMRGIDDLTASIAQQITNDLAS